MTKAKSRSAAEWRQIIRAWERSGKRRGEFAAEHGLSESSLSWWRWRLKTNAGAAPTKGRQQPVELVRVEVDSERRSGPEAEPGVAWELETARGHVLRVYEGATAAEGIREALASLARMR